jgi:hypothetical protein
MNILRAMFMTSWNESRQSDVTAWAAGASGGSSGLTFRTDINSMA